MLSLFKSAEDASTLTLFQRLLTFIALLQLPFFFFILSAESGADGRWYVLHFTMLLTAVLYAVECILTKKKTFKRPPAVILFGFGLGLLATLSLLWSINILSAIWNWKHLVSYVLLMFFCYKLYTPKFLRSILWVLTFGLLYNSVLAIGQYHDLFSEWFNTKFIQQAAIPGGTFTNKNLLAQFIMLMLPVSFYLLITSKNRIRQAISFTALTTGLIAFTYTRTRISWVSFVVTLICFSLWFIFNKQAKESLKNSCSKAKVGLIALSIAITAFGASLPSAHKDTYGIKNSMADQVKSITTLTGSLEGRFHFYLNSLEIFKDNAFTGVGIGNFRSAFPKYHDAAIKTRTSSYNIAKRPERVHSDPIQVLVELGIFGLIFYIGIFASFIYMLVRINKSELGASEKLLTNVLSFSVFAIIVNSIADFPLQMPGSAMPLYAFLGLIAALYTKTISVKECTPNKHVTTGYKIMLTASLSIVLCLVSYDDAKRIHAGYAHKVLRSLNSMKVFNKNTLIAANVAYQRYPRNIRTLEARAITYFMLKEKVGPAALIMAHEELLKHDPYAGNIRVNYMNSLNAIGIMHLKSGNKDVAFKILEASIQSFPKLQILLPFEPHPYALVAQAYLLKEEFPNAYSYFNKSLKVEPSFDMAIKGKHIARTFAQKHLNKIGSKQSLDDYLAGKLAGPTLGQKIFNAMQKKALEGQKSK